MGTTNTVVVDDPSALAPATAIAQAQIHEIDRVCSRFRVDSELSRLNRCAGGDEFLLTPLLEEALVAALDTALMSGGLVDPTVGANVVRCGYTVTFRDLPADGPALEARIDGVAGWQALGYDPLAHTLRLPRGVAIDLGASGKAWAADRAAMAVFDALGVTVMVGCGGDIAMRGKSPDRGWPVRVASAVEAADWQDVMVFDGGLATSGTNVRSWRRGGAGLHHIIDPRTGVPAQTPWVMVTAAAASCLEANAAATAALILGEEGPSWLNAHGLPARLVAHDGSIRFAGGWDA